MNKRRTRLAYPAPRGWASRWLREYYPDVDWDLIDKYASPRKIVPPKNGEWTKAESVGKREKGKRDE